MSRKSFFLDQAKVGVSCLFLVGGALLFSTAIWLGLSGISSAQDFAKSWRDKSGKFEIKATFVDIVGKKLKLKDEKGKIIEIELSKLNEFDKRFAESLKFGKDIRDNNEKHFKNGPFGNKKAASTSKKKKKKVEEEEVDDEEENPFETKTTQKSSKKKVEADEEESEEAVEEEEEKPKKKKKPAKKAKEEAEEEEEEEAEEGPEAKEIDVTTAPLISGVPLQKEFKVPVGTSAPGKVTENSNAVNLPAKDNIFQRASSLHISQQSGLGVLTIKKSSPGTLNADTEIIYFDVNSGAVLKTYDVEGAYVALAIDPTGRRVLAREDRIGPQGGQAIMEMWMIGDEKLNRDLRWTSNKKDQLGRAAKTSWGHFLDNETFLTCAANGLVTAWKLPELKPLYTLSVLANSTPAVSPDGKYLAYLGNQQLTVFDLAQKKVLCTQAVPVIQVKAVDPVPSTFPGPRFGPRFGPRGINPNATAAAPTVTTAVMTGRLSYSPSGKYIAAAGSGRIRVWNVETGKMQSDFACSVAAVDQPIYFTGDRYLFVSGVCVDLEKQALLWNYQGSEEYTFAGNRLWFATKNLLMPTIVPHQEAVNAMASVDTDPNVVLKPGTGVVLNLNGVQIDEKMRNEVAAALSERLKENGCTVDPQGTIELALVLDPPKDQKATYRGLGPGRFGRPDVEEVTVQIYTLRLRFNHQGTTVWEQVFEGELPHITRLGDNETLQEHLQKFHKPKYETAKGALLPKYIRKGATVAHGLGVMGTTNIANGQF